MSAINFCKTILNFLLAACTKTVTLNEYKMASLINVQVHLLRDEQYPSIKRWRRYGNNRSFERKLSRVFQDVIKIPALINF